MSWLDYALLAVILISALISLVRGFVKESISLVTWGVAGFLAFRYFFPLSELLESLIDAPTLRRVVAFGLLFVATLIAGAIVNFIVSQLVIRTGLSGTDRALGVVFGTARGVLIVAIIVLLLSLTPLPQEDAWKDAATISFFEQLADWLKSVIPADTAENFRF